MSDWVRVKKDEPCAICLRPSWCTFTSDGKSACCMRVESSHALKNGGWLHKLSDDFVPKPRPKRKPASPPPDFTEYARNAFEGFDPTSFAKKLCVDPEALRRLRVGYAKGAYTFPMRDETNRIIGIRTRTPGGKFCVPGSKNGLFIPAGLTFKERLYIAEGATDPAALLTLGFESLGRPSCSGGVEMLFNLIEAKNPPDIVIVSDNDPPKQRPNGAIYYPGQDGAKKLGTELMKLTRNIRIIIPPSNKDIREWVASGATAKAIEALVEGSRYGIH